MFSNTFAIEFYMEFSIHFREEIVIVSIKRINRIELWAFFASYLRLIWQIHILRENCPLFTYQYFSCSIFTKISILLLHDSTHWV